MNKKEFNFNNIFNSESELSQFIIVLSRIHFDLRICAENLLSLAGDKNNKVDSNLETIVYFQSQLYSHTREAIKTIHSWKTSKEAEAFLERHNLLALAPDIKTLKKNSFKDGGHNEHLDRIRNKTFHYTKFKERDELNHLFDYISKQDKDQFILSPQNKQAHRIELSIEKYLTGSTFVEGFTSDKDFVTFLEKSMRYCAQILSFTEYCIECYMKENGIEL